MSIILSVGFLCLVQIASANEGYGVPRGNDYSPPSKYDDNEYHPVYEQKPYGSYGPSYGGYNNDYSREDKRSCDDLRNLHIKGERTTRVLISDPLERKGRSYLQLSCKNNNRAYAIVAEKKGSKFKIGDVEYKDKIMLAAGFNLDFVAECHSRGRTVGRAMDGEKYSFRKVTCLQLNKVLAPPL